MKKNSRKILSLLLAALFVFTSLTGCSKTPVEEVTYEKGSLFNYNSQSAYSAANWKLGSNTGKLDTSTVKNIRARYTEILGKGKDTVTILVYMCGADLESSGAMGSYDLQEMASATISDKVNLIVYTGGSTKWHLSEISSKYNQIYQILGNGKVNRLVENAGSPSMTDPSTLVDFIEYGVKNFPANRYELIMWDHGAGSVNGYGYDEKYPKTGSMGLDKIDEALTEADVKFDFIGFDACLMANAETALMLTEHADYLIASEESEPGIGWYYTDWLTALSKNTSMSTIEIGKAIADSFVSTCSAKTPKQAATLSVIDLAEVELVLSDKLSAFSKSATNLINNKQYKVVASARSGAREFATSSNVDLVDLCDLANSVNTTEAQELVKAVLSCVKYNNTSKSMTDAYGMSIYFPYRSSKYVTQVLNTYKNIELTQDYIDCVKGFATYQTSGQVASGGTHTANQSFSGYNSESYYSNQSSTDMIVDLLSLFLTGGTSSGSQQSSGNNSQSSSSNVDPYAILISYGLNALFGNKSIDRTMAEYIYENHFDADLTWKNGKIAMTEKQWAAVENLKLNVFINDGTGYIDLGTDNYFEVDDKGNLEAISDMTWLAGSADNSHWQVMPYYFLYAVEDGDSLISYGRVPVLLNGNLAYLILELSDEAIEVVGVTYDYKDVNVVAKSLTQLEAGDTIEFVCDYYDYDGNFSDTYKLGETITIVDQFYVGDVDISSYDYLATYQITDIFQQNYWTTPME